MKLGKKPPRHDARTLRLERYVAAALPSVPASIDYTTRVHKWPMFANDRIGDCAIAGPAHQIEAWTATDAHRTASITEAQVLKSYSAVSGYVPGDDSTDVGCVLLDVMNAWRKKGLCTRTHKIDAYASVRPRDTAMVRAGIYLAGGLTIGLNLPLAAQDLSNWGKAPPGRLTGDWEPGSWGGHCVVNLAYDRNGMVAVTWGELVRMSYAFFAAYCDEAYAALAGKDWLGKDGRAPNGFDAAALAADLAQL
jgi:hypothetical protein